MSRFNPHLTVEPIYKAVEDWRDQCLLADGSILSEGKTLWSKEVLDELDKLIVKNPDARKKVDFFSKLEGQLLHGSLECKQLAAELLWGLLLFPHEPNIKAKTKRQNIRKIWSWSGVELSEDQPLLSDTLFKGIGSADPGFGIYLWLELVFLITAIREFKSRGPDDRKRILGDPWAFSSWLSSIPEKGNRQLIHILPHLLFPDSFERISSQGDKRKILVGFGETSKKEVKKWDPLKIDRALLELRSKLEQENGTDIDFYEIEARKVWQTPSLPPELPTPKNETKPPPPLTVATREPENLILYGPPGTGKTYRLMNDYLPQYQEEQGENRCEFITFHQSYAYEDFVEGIRPVTLNGNITYEVQDGVLRRLCDRARKAPSQRFALLIDEINRGNIAKIFGELISLVEIDKRIKTDTSGKRLPGCEGLEVTLPYSGERFGVPANVDIIGTMNTADRSIALLDTALRRRFHFEELPPNPKLLKSIDDGTGGKIDLRKLLEVMNSRLEHLLDRDQTLGHSYFCKVETFKDLRRSFAHEILPFLQEVFYDDQRQIRLVLGNQLVQTHKQKANELFPNAGANEVDDGETFEIVRQSNITPDAIRKIYDPRKVDASPVAE